MKTQDLKKLTRYTKEVSQPKLFVTLSGAHLYGYAAKNSPVQMRGVFLQPVRHVLGLFPSDVIQEKSWEKKDAPVLLTCRELRLMCEAILRHEGTILEQIYSPHVVEAMPAHEELKDIAAKCLTRHHHSHYITAFRAEWNKFLMQDPACLPTLLNVYRVLMTGIHLMQSGHIECHLPTLNEEFQLPLVDELINRRLAGEYYDTADKIDVPRHEFEVQRLVERLIEEAGRSGLPDHAECKDPLNDFLVRLRLNE